LRSVGRLPFNHTRVDGSGLSITQAANIATGRFGSGPEPELTIRNCCQR
jgi:hypothetical protein